MGGGGRSGKTFWWIRAMIIRSLLAPGSRHVIFKYRFNSLAAAVIADTFPKVMQLCFPEGMYNPDNWVKSPNYYYQFDNGSQIWFGGLDDKERTEKILGQEFVTMGFNECSQIPWQSVELARSRLAQKVCIDGTTDEMNLKCYYDFNPPSKRHWTYLYFIEKKHPISRKPIRDPFSIGYCQMNPADNLDNISSAYLDELDNMSDRARKRFKLGEFADDDEGMLWTDEVLEVQRELATADKPLPNFVRIVIAVDPSGCSGDEDERSDEVGITVIGLGTNGHAYVIEDLSGKWGPEQWASIVNSAFERHMADAVIAEQNFGGDMVRATMQAENSNLPVKLVHASRGKVVRAEPISHLYNKGMVHHVGYFPELEEQMLDFSVAGYQGIKSPDRADSLIWGLTELFPSIKQETQSEDFIPPEVKTRPRSASRYDRS